VVLARGAGNAEPGQVRRAAALAMSVLENTGVMVLGHITATGSPARATARAAKARGTRAVVLDHAGGPVLAELRRRTHGSVIAVVAADAA
jgi:hypothetical protein